MLLKSRQVVKDADPAAALLLDPIHDFAETMDFTNTIEVAGFVKSITQLRRNDAFSAQLTDEQADGLDYLLWRVADRTADKEIKAAVKSALFMIHTDDIIRTEPENKQTDLIKKLGGENKHFLQLSKAYQTNTETAYVPPIPA